MALAVALFLGAAARAEAAPSRTKRDRPVTVTINPAESLPEIHVAPDVPTLLLFPADIQKKTITVDQSRIRVVDTGGRSIIDEIRQRRLPATLGAALKKARKRAGMTQAEAAEGVGIAPEVYGRMERGECCRAFQRCYACG